MRYDSLLSKLTSLSSVYHQRPSSLLLVKASFHYRRYLSSTLMSTVPKKEVLLVGYGAVGAVCESLPIMSFLRPCSASLSSISTLCVDAYVLEKSGRAHVTAVARSNYDVITSTFKIVLLVWSGHNS